MQSYNTFHYINDLQISKHFVCSCFNLTLVPILQLRKLREEKKGAAKRGEWNQKRWVLTCPGISPFPHPEMDCILCSPRELPLHARQCSLPSTLGIACRNQALSCCQWDCGLPVHGGNQVMSPGALWLLLFSPWPTIRRGELLRINYFSKDLQSLNAPGGIFFFFLTILGKFSVYFQHKDATASVIRTEKMKLFSIGYRLRVSIRNSYACKFSFVMHLLTFLLCCQC